jgi:hypothetical protein
VPWTQGVLDKCWIRDGREAAVDEARRAEILERAAGLTDEELDELMAFLDAVEAAADPEP